MATMTTVRSREIVDRLHLPSSNTLTRWRRSGYIRAQEIPSPGSGIGTTWPEWTLRMAALLRQEGAGVYRPDWRRRSRGMYLQVAHVLEQHPDVPFIIFVDEDDGQPCWTDENAAAMLASAHHQATIIAPPDLDDIGESG